MANYLIAIYDCDRAYGGPEEGGWWYDTGHFIKLCKVFKNEDQAYSYCRRLNKKLESRAYGPNAGKRYGIDSVLSEGEFQAKVFEDFAPKCYPESKPHYE